MKISFDLDDVLFVSPDNYEVEPELRFPLNRMFPERLRKGTVRLIHELQARGFEVWVYTSSFRSEKNIFSSFLKVNFANSCLDGFSISLYATGEKLSNSKYFKI